MTPPKIYGLIGYPVKHSLSPVMHNAAFRALGINAEYKLFEVKPDELASFLSLPHLQEANIFGLNVTIPHKERCVGFTQWQSPEVRFTGAANTLVINKDNRLNAWNTDGIGFHRHLLMDLKFDPAGKKAIILGAGGAAKAVADQLARKGARSLLIYDIDVSKRKQLSEKINKEFPACESRAADSIEKIDTKDFDLLVNATPVGLKENDPCLISPQKLHPKLLVYDLIYNPPETKLLKLAREMGANFSNGLGMLLYQGMLSFEIWTGEKPPQEIMRAALTERLKNG